MLQAMPPLFAAAGNALSQQVAASYFMPLCMGFLAIVARLQALSLQVWGTGKAPAQGSWTGVCGQRGVGGAVLSPLKCTDTIIATHFFPAQLLAHLQTAHITAAPAAGYLLLFLFSFLLQLCISFSFSFPPLLPPASAAHLCNAHLCNARVFTHAKYLHSHATICHALPFTTRSVCHAYACSSLVYCTHACNGVWTFCTYLFVHPRPQLLVDCVHAYNGLASLLPLLPPGDAECSRAPPHVQQAQRAILQWLGRPPAGARGGVDPPAGPACGGFHAGLSSEGAPHEDMPCGRASGSSGSGAAQDLPLDALLPPMLALKWRPATVAAAAAHLHGSLERAAPPARGLAPASSACSAPASCPKSSRRQRGALGAKAAAANAAAEAALEVGLAVCNRTNGMSCSWLLATWCQLLITAISLADEDDCSGFGHSCAHLRFLVPPHLSRSRLSTT